MTQIDIVYWGNMDNMNCVSMCVARHMTTFLNRMCAKKYILCQKSYTGSINVYFFCVLNKHCSSAQLNIELQFKHFQYRHAFTAARTLLFTHFLNSN